MTAETRPNSSHAYVLQPEEGQRIDNLGLRLLATGARTGDALTAAVCTNPGPGGPPLHIHAAIDELYYVLKGRYRFKIGDDEIEGGPGTFAYVPRGTAHTFASVGPEEGQMIAVTLPGTERFLYGISDLQSHGMDQQDMVEHFRNFDSEIIGPPLI